MPSRLDDWLTRIQEQHPPRIELGLERCAAVWDRMGRPEPARKIVTVAGTNGKGSTVAFLEAMLLALGRRVGTYTSPHLAHYNERIRIDGVELPDADIVSGFERVDSCAEGEPLTYFEFGTLAALASLAAADLEYAILEVGLGGRLDAVNIIDPDCAVVTPVGIDHEAYLGENRELIGAEKAGILRKGVRFVCSDRSPPRSLRRLARDLECRYVQIGRDFDVIRSGAGWRYRFADVDMTIFPSMRGEHQADNLACALTVVLAMEEEAVNRAAEISQAGANIQIRGRLETISTAPEIIVDVGHNPLAASVITRFLETRPSGPVHVVLGMLHDKDCEGFARGLGNKVKSWYCGSLNGERKQSGTELADRLRSAVGPKGVRSFSSVPEALDAAIVEAGCAGTVLACGSFRTAAETISHVESIEGH